MISQLVLALSFTGMPYFELPIICDNRECRVNFAYRPHRQVERGWPLTCQGFHITGRVREEGPKVNVSVACLDQDGTRHLHPPRFAITRKDVIDAN